MRSIVSAHARAREVAGAAFYTHVATVARQPGDAGVENRPEGVVGENRPEEVVGENRPEEVVGENRPEEVVGENRSKDVDVDWERSLFPITLRPTRHRRSSEYFHPRDPRRQRQLERERDEFATKWTTGNNENRGEDGGDEWKIDQCEGIREDEGGGYLRGNGPGEGGRTVVLITIGENGDESEARSRTETNGKRFREEDGGGSWDELTRSSSGSKIEGRPSSSKTTKKHRMVWLDHGSPEALSTPSTAVDDGNPVGAKRPKITKDDSRFCDTPELLDERVGNANPFIVRIPRTAITLNLNSYNNHHGGSAKKDTGHARPSTEIRLADSSVPDLPLSCNEASVVQVEKCNVTKKPKIIEDLTCLEGTILSRASLKKFAEGPADPTTTKTTPEADEKPARNGGEDDAPRRIRIREKFRRLFGNDVTLSESDEEKRITAKLTSRKRRNESRMSSDSGVCLNEHTSDMTCSEALEKQGDSENPGECPREKLRKNTEEDLGEYTKEGLGEYPRENTKEHLREYTVESLREYPMENLRENTEDLREFTKEGFGEYPMKNTKKDLREFTKENRREYPRESLRKNPRENPEEYTGKNPKANPKEYARKNPREYAGKNPREHPKGNSIGRSREFRSEDPKECPNDDPREFVSEDPREISPMEKEDTEVESAQVLSMPLLDAVCEKRAAAARDEALPDSSTSLLEKMSTQPDSSSGGKFTILVTPLNIQDSDAFDPLRLEFDLSEEAQISTPTSTTSGPPIVEPLKLESGLEDRQNLVGTYVDDSCQIGDRISVKEDLSSEAETESYDGYRLIIAEDLESETGRSPGEREASEESVQRILDPPILPQWRPESMSGSETKSSNVTNVNSSSDSNATADKNVDESKDLAGSSLPIEEVARPETALEVREKNSKDLTSVIETSSGAHQKVLIISARIVDFDPASGMLVGPGEAIKVSDETSPETVDLDPESGPDKHKLENSTAKLSEITIDDSLTVEQKSVNVAFEFELDGLTPAGLEDRTNFPGTLDGEVPDSEIPKCVLDAQKPKDVPKAPNFRVLHPSELGSRWCPTPLATEAPQSQPQFAPQSTVPQPRFAPSPAIAQPRFTPSPVMAQARFSPNPALAQPPLYPQFPRYPNSQILRNPSYPQIRHPPPEVLIQTPPPSPLEQMQFLVSQTSSSGHGVEDLSSKKSSGYVNVSLGPRPVHTGSGLPSSWTVDKHQHWSTPTSSPSAESPLEKHSLMSRIFECLISMASFIERIRRESDMTTILQIDKDYAAKRELLFVELRRYACTQGTNDLRTIVGRVMNYYDYLVIPERRTLNVEAVHYMLKLERAVMASALYVRPAEPRPPPPYRPNRPSVTQSSPFTESQRLLLYNQMSAYCRLQNVLNYQLVAQRRAEEEAASAKRTRRRNPRAPAGQSQAVQASAAGGRERPNLSTRRELQRIAPAPVDHPRTLQQTVECNVERVTRNEGAGNCTVTDKRHEDIVELALRDASMDKAVADIVNDLFRQHPTERMSEGQDVERNSQSQDMVGNIQGQSVDVNVQGRSVDVNVQGQSIDVNVQDQGTDINAQGRRIDISVQGQRTDANAQGQRIDINVQGQSIGVTFQGQGIDSNVQGQSVEENVQFQAIEGNAQCQTTERNLQGHIIERSVQGQAIYTNVRGQTVERSVQVQTIEINVEGQDVEKSSQGQIIEINVEGQDIEKSNQGQIIGRAVQGQAIDINIRGQYTEKSVQGQPIEMTVQGQDIEKSRQGQAIEMTVQGQIIERSVQGQPTDINVRGQCTEKSVQGQAIETPVQGQDVAMTVQGQNIKKSREGQIIENSVQGQPIDINIRGQCTEKSVQGQPTVDIEAQTNEANVPAQAVTKSVHFDPIEVNGDNVQGQAIEEDSPVDSPLNRSTSSMEDGNTSVLDVLKEFEILDSITKGPVSRGSKLRTTTKPPQENKLPDSIAKERGSKAADSKCPEDSPGPTTTSASADDGKTDDDKASGLATSADVEAGSSRIVPVITIDDDEDWDLASTNSVETVRDAEVATIADEISILDVKSISKDVFNNMGVKVDDETTGPAGTTDEAGREEVCIDIKTELGDCFQCGKRSEVVCEQCRLAAYCSPECHQEHWSAIHHLTCKPAPQEIIETTE